MLHPFNYKTPKNQLYPIKKSRVKPHFISAFLTWFIRILELISADIYDNCFPHVLNIKWVINVGLIIFVSSLVGRTWNWLWCFFRFLLMICVIFLCLMDVRLVVACDCCSHRLPWVTGNKLNVRFSLWFTTTPNTFILAGFIMNSV